MTGLVVKPQIACDRCTQGVMDSTNDHLLGKCSCKCHGNPPDCKGKGPPVKGCECSFCQQTYRYLTNLHDR